MRGGPPEWAGRVATTRHRWDCRGRCAPLALVGCLVGIHTPTAPGWATGAVARWGASGTASHCQATVAFASCTQCPRSSPRPQLLLRPSGGVCGVKGFGLQYSGAGHRPKSKTRGALAGSGGGLAVRVCSCQLPGSRAGALSAALPSSHLFTVSQLSESGRPLPHVDRRTGPASQSQLSCVSETATGSCVGPRMAPREYTHLLRLPLSSMFAVNQYCTARSRCTVRGY